MVVWISILLGTEIGLGSGHIVLDEEGAQQPPTFTVYGRRQACFRIIIIIIIIRFVKRQNVKRLPWR